MANLKQTNKNNKQSTNNNFWQKLRHLPWYTKLGLVLIIGFVLFSVFKYSVNKYNISLLDKAEAKMRAMNVPKADYTTYRRSCSFRSVKFGGAGSPNCRLQRTDIYRSSSTQGDAEIARSYFKEYKNLSENTTANFNSDAEIADKINSSVDSAPILESLDFQQKLKCYAVSLNQPAPFTELDHGVEPGENGYLVISNSCYKEFMFQTYPEL